MAKWWSKRRGWREKSQWHSQKVREFWAKWCWWQVEGTGLPLSAEVQCACSRMSIILVLVVYVSPALLHPFLSFQNSPCCWPSCFSLGTILELCFGTSLMPWRGFCCLAFPDHVAAVCRRQAKGVWDVYWFKDSALHSAWAKWLSRVITITNFTDKMGAFVNLV